MAPAEITDEFRQDAIAGFETQLGRYVNGCEKIAHDRGISAEQAHREIADEVERLGLGMPGTI